MYGLQSKKQVEIVLEWNLVKNRITLFLFITTMMLALTYQVTASQEKESAILPPPEEEWRILNLGHCAHPYMGGSIIFPREAHPNETIAHWLTIGTCTDVFVNSINVTVEYADLVKAGRDQTIYEENIMKDELMTNRDEIVETLVLTMPENAIRGRLVCYISASLNVTTNPYRSTTTFTTHVRQMTYYELNSAYYDLKYSYESLEKKLYITEHLMYAFLITTTVLVALTIYFRVKAR